MSRPTTIDYNNPDLAAARKATRTLFETTAAAYKKGRTLREQIESDRRLTLEGKREEVEKVQRDVTRRLLLLLDDARSAIKSAVAKLQRREELASRSAPPFDDLGPLASPAERALAGRLESIARLLSRAEAERRAAEIAASPDPIEAALGLWRSIHLSGDGLALEVFSTTTLPRVRAAHPTFAAALDGVLAEEREKRLPEAAREARELRAWIESGPLFYTELLAQEIEGNAFLGATSPRALLGASADAALAGFLKDDDGK